ncbi:MAG: tRNA lysidine(34) synthetase TilS [Jatrophihabitantaceae bacterium]
MGPHPAVAEVRRAVRVALAQAFPEPTATSAAVLVACSGGADSLALAAATAFEAPRRGLRAGLVTVDHGLQPGSAERAARAAAIGYQLGLDPVTILAVEVGAEGGPEAAARTARYAALDVAAGAHGASVLLGHTLDDQAETVLLGLGRGSGPRSIAGMRAADGPYLRPLLNVRRASTLAACTALGLTPWDDPHNADPTFQRVRLRLEVLPLLEEVLQGGVAEALARTAALVRDDLDVLDHLAATAATAAAPPPTSDRDQDALDAVALAELPRALRRRALQAWSRHHGAGALSAVHLAALDALVVDWHGQGPLDLPGARVARASGKLVITPQPRDPQE